jgi:ABC-type bacteriocin/lantibiotic exporter with double-glycine peptidase domain
MIVYGWLLGGLLLLIGGVTVYQERTLLKTTALLKKQGRATLVERIEQSPPSPHADSANTVASRFLTSQQTGLWLVAHAVVSLAVNVMSFLVTLVISGVPLWAYLIMIVLIATISLNAYRSAKNATLFKQAGDQESNFGDLLAELHKSRNNPQVHPAIKRELQNASEQASETRIKSNAYTAKHFLNVRTTVNTAVCCAAVVAAYTLAGTPTATLLMLFIFTFGGYVTTIHGLATSMETVETNGTPMIELLSRAPQPVLPPQLDQVCIQASGLVVRYPGKEQGDDTLVSIPDRKLESGGIYIFTGRNGAGKSSLFNVLVGVGEYSGELRLWGHQVRDWDCSKFVVSFQQKRTPLSITIEDAFSDEHGSVNLEIRDYALWCVDAEDISLQHVHKKLSGGQQQKIDLALAIYRSLVDAEQIGLVILDEPTNNIDRGSLALMKDRLCDFLGRLDPSVTVLIAIHEPSIQQALLQLPNSEEVM